MPKQSDAVSFVKHEQTSTEQLRTACRILGLESERSRDELLARLDAYLINLDPDAPMVCLNPEPQPKE